MEAYAKGFTKEELASLAKAQMKDVGYKPEPGDTVEDILQATGGDQYIEKLYETDETIVILSQSCGIQHVVALKKDADELYSEALQIA